MSLESADRGVKEALYSNQPVYFKINPSSNELADSEFVEGIGPVINCKPCRHPYVFHALVCCPTGEFINSRTRQNRGPITIGHQEYVFSYTVPKNNITADNNRDYPERTEMRAIVGESFYNLVFKTRYGQRVIRLGSATRDGYLAVLKGAGFQRIYRLGNEGGANWYRVYQAIRKDQAQIADVIKIDGSTAHRIYGFYHCPHFEYVPGLVGLVPIEEYLRRCSSQMRSRLEGVANMVFTDKPLPLPPEVAQYVRANNSVLNGCSW